MKPPGARFFSVTPAWVIGTHVYVHVRGPHTAFQAVDHPIWVIFGLILCEKGSPGGPYKYSLPEFPLPTPLIGDYKTFKIREISRISRYK